MYRVYRLFAEVIDVDVLGRKRITDQLREYETLKLINMSRTSEGYREGTYLQVRLLEDPQLILQSLGLCERMAEIPIDSAMRNRIINAIES